MAYIENDLNRLAFAIKEIEGYLVQGTPRVGDALYTCHAVLSSLDGTDAGKAALEFASRRFTTGA